MTRKMKKQSLIIATSALMAITTQSLADNRDFALTGKIGTTGLGLESTFRTTDQVNLRLGGYGFDYSTEVTETAVTYDGRLRLRSLALIADWHPNSGGLRASVGIFYNGNKFSGSAEGSVTLDDVIYEGSLNASADWRSLAPYVGVGYGNAVSGSNWSFAIDAGLMFTGSPRVRLSGQVNDPSLQSDFDDARLIEQRRLQEEVNDFKYFPVLSIGVSYAF